MEKREGKKRLRLSLKSLTTHYIVDYKMAMPFRSAVLMCGEINTPYVTKQREK